MFIWLVKFRNALLPVVTYLEEKRFAKLVSWFNFVLVIQQHDYLITYDHWACYVLFPVVTSLEEKRFDKLVSRFTFVLVSNQRLTCYICSLGVLRVVSSCYIFISEKVCETSFHVRFCISFQPTNRRKCLSNQFPGSIQYQFPTLEYLVTYISWACYVLLPGVTSLQKKMFFKPFSRFTFVIVSTPRLPCYICSLGLLLVFSSCYIFMREPVCQTRFQVHFFISFQPPNTLLHVFAGLVTRCYQLLYLYKRKGL